MTCKNWILNIRQITIFFFLMLVGVGLLLLLIFNILTNKPIKSVLAIMRITYIVAHTLGKQELIVVAGKIIIALARQYGFPFQIIHTYIDSRLKICYIIIKPIPITIMLCGLQWM